MNVALYIRVSTEEQAKFGLSLDAQEQALKKYCKDNKYNIFGIYKDDGISASTIKKRKGLLRLLDDLDKIDIILFTKLDRLSRNIKDAIELNEMFKEHNVKMIAVQDQYIDTSTANGEFIFNLRYALAQQERKQVSERIKAINEYKRNVSKTAVTGKLPLGYALDEEKHIIVSDSNIILDLFNHYLTSGNLSQTRQWYENKYGNVHYDTIRRRLRCKRYTGDGLYPQIIPIELFDKVQVLLDKNIKATVKNKANDTVIFNRLLKCSICGSSFRYQFNRNKNVYYTCERRYKNNCHSKAFLSEIRLEKYLIDNLPTELKKLKIKSKKYLKIDIQDITKQKTKLNDKLDRIQKAYINGILEYELYKKEYQNTKLELSKLEEPKHNIEELDRLLKSNVFDIYKTFSKNEKRIFWRNIINSIEVKSTNELIIKFVER